MWIPAFAGMTRKGVKDEKGEKGGRHKCRPYKGHDMSCPYGPDGVGALRIQAAGWGCFPWFGGLVEGRCVRSWYMVPISKRIK